MANVATTMFQRFDFDSEEGQSFGRDLTRFINLSDDTRKQCLDAVIPMLLAATTSERERHEERLLQAADAPAPRHNRRT